MVVHHGTIELASLLGVPRSQYVGVVDHGDRDDLVIRDLDAGQTALGSTVGTRERRAADAYDGEQACGGILNGLLDVLAEMAHPRWLSVRADGRSRVRGSVPQTERRDIGGRNQFNIGSGFEHGHQRGA